MIFMILISTFLWIIFNDHDLFWSFVLPSTVWYDLVMALFCWNSLVSFWLIMMSLNLTQPVIFLLLFFSFPDVDALMMSHLCVQHLLGCESFVGFLRASGRCSFHWVDYPMRMWHLCVQALGAKYTLELFLKYHAFPPLSRKRVCWPASWGGVKCPMPFSFWPLEKSPVNKQAHSSALKIRWTTGLVSVPNHPPPNFAFPEYVWLAFFLLFLSVSFILI